MIRLPPRSKRTDTLFPYTTLFRSIPIHVAEAWLQASKGLQNSFGLCGGVGGALGIFGPPTDPLTGQDYDSANYPELNGGAGFYTDLSGNELPNSPRWTVNLGAEYTIPFEGDRKSTRLNSSH